VESFLIVLGLIGSVLVLAAYFALASGRLNKDDPRYYWLNILATAMLLASLMVQWNLPAVVSQVVWIILSLTALWRIRKVRSK
jgi:hypothetical protein